MLGNHFWWLFQGPRGIGVDMCGLDEQFELVKLWPHPGTANIDSPPFPTKITVKVRYDGRQECSYYNDGKGNAGRLVCADPSPYSTDFKRDPQWDKPTEVCKGKRMHRGYFVEYGT
ncbi:hypothetical protein AA0121_g12427 [Alternaria tenuissima]|nr:hypothetical protein AA0114_g11899 [Alternaria tenuissima]RYO05375.1 hypothetical protein AA0121_g12427 [Alternaria tenuissima]